MKRCSLYGNQSPDDVAVCPTDRQPLVKEEEKPSQPVPAAQVDVAVLDARLVAPLSAAGTYRIFVRGSDLIFILLHGGGASILETVAAHLGPAGLVVNLIRWLCQRREARQLHQRLEAEDPEDLFPGNESNFRLNASEIREAAIEPPSAWRTSGKQAGRLNLAVRYGEELKLELETPEAVATALHLLKPLLSSKLRVNLVWNGQKRRFEKPGQ